MKDLIACKDCDRVFFLVRRKDAADVCPDCGNTGKPTGWYRVVSDA